MHVVFFILGLCLGSFINAAVYRINPAGDGGVIQKNKHSLLKGRSICPHCQKPLVWWQLVPVLSYIALRGRCHNCRKPISLQYPIIELFTGSAILLYSLQHPGQYVVVAWGAAIIALLVFIGLYDFKKYIILDSTVLLGSVLALGWRIFQGSWQPALWGAAGLTIFFALIYFLSKGKWMGFGDVKLAVFLGLLHDPTVFFVLLISSWLGTIAGLLLIAGQRGNLKTELPFGTFLSLSSIGIFIWQEQIEAVLRQIYL